jgi:PiT family inorganic phosphate transporter
MVFALLIAAIIWNLGTWWLALPASSSHTMIGSIIGVGVANALMRGRDGTSGVDWSKATEIGEALLLSPIVGFVLAEGTFPSLGALMREIADQVMEYGTLGKIPAAVVRNTRNDMYLAAG